MNPSQLSTLLCPLCKQALRYEAEAQELVCEHDKLAFPIKDGIPVMLKDEARSLVGEATSTTQDSQAE